MAEYQLCPKCNGQGTVSLPPWIDGDTDEFLNVDIGGFTCDICEGEGLLIKPEREEGYDPITYSEREYFSRNVG